MCDLYRWGCYAFDVATAFLSGNNTDRLVYVKAPAEGLPGTDASTPVGPYELMRVVKSAYGLSEAPRLWYLHAVELLNKCGMIEIPFCRSTFIAKDGEEVFAFCGLHVDDGLLIGNPQNPKFDQLRQAIDGVFNIKAWETVGSKGTDYLGMKIFYDPENGIMIDDMTDYALKIENVDLSKVTKGKLMSEDLTRFRQLVMRMRWPAQHVWPEFMFRISSLAQRVGTASFDDMKEAHSLCSEMHAAAHEGRAKITYRPLQGEHLFVTYFDAALGRKHDGSAQSGEFHLLTDSQALLKSRCSNVLEYHSNKISRIVRSSIAAESCALTRAADHQLYNRLLFDALRFGRIDIGSGWRSQLQIPGILVTDAKALYDHCSTTGHLAQERQTAIDLLMAKQMIEEKHMALRWVPTFKQLADSLTKAMKDLLLIQWKRDGQICLISTDQDLIEESRRASIRKGQRERRAARGAKLSSETLRFLQEHFTRQTVHVTVSPQVTSLRHFATNSCTLLCFAVLCCAIYILEPSHGSGSLCLVLVGFSVFDWFNTSMSSLDVCAWLNYGCFGRWAARHEIGGDFENNASCANMGIFLRDGVSL